MICIIISFSTHAAHMLSSHSHIMYITIHSSQWSAFHTVDCSIGALLALLSSVKFIAHVPHPATSDAHHLCSYAPCASAPCVCGSVPPLSAQNCKCPDGFTNKLQTEQARRTKDSLSPTRTTHHQQHVPLAFPIPVCIMRAEYYTTATRTRTSDIGTTTPCRPSSYFQLLQ